MMVSSGLSFGWESVEIRLVCLSEFSKHQLLSRDLSYFCTLHLSLSPSDIADVSLYWMRENTAILERD